MVTTRRSAEMVETTYDSASNRGGVDLLERPQLNAQVEQTESEVSATEQTERI